MPPAISPPLASRQRPAFKHCRSFWQNRTIDIENALYRQVNIWPKQQGHVKCVLVSQSETTCLSSCNEWGCLMSEDGNGIQSVKTALDILESIAFYGEGAGVTQIAERVRLTKGSVHRHLQTLVDRGYLAQDAATTRYYLGSKSRLLSQLSPELDLVRAADGPMRKLRDLLGQTVSLTEMTPRGALVLATLVGSSPIEIVVRLGSELSFHSSAQGKILLAFAPPALQERELRKPLRAFSSKTKTGRRELKAELEKIRELGYASAAEEMLLGLNAIAVGIFDEAQVCVGSIAIVGSIQYVSAVPDRRSLAALKETAREISKSLGRHNGASAPAGARGLTIRRPGKA
ncbi:IclR family transcriptional regulator [Roseiarcaceae bacterium H3SJ34-1]|uniref:IclR family transcriptional regulator n=1 Tax=Terripilifer ovatus TaxID=3032367 RepID=UPI003AB92D85|nr:IclR family transcriptional regulator [Roseiarcaceae bacterium H3SJ34-1]